MTVGKYDQVKQLIKDGKRAEAQAELAAMVRADPGDADAWYGLAQVVDDAERRRYCLEKAHRLRPDSDAVANELQRFADRSANSQIPMMKTCPYCAEEIQDSAIVCKYCGRDIRPQVAQANRLAATGKFLSSVGTLLMFIGCLAMIAICLLIYIV